MRSIAHHDHGQKQERMKFFAHPFRLPRRAGKWRILFFAMLLHSKNNHAPFSRPLLRFLDSLLSIQITASSIPLFRRAFISMKSAIPMKIGAFPASWRGTLRSTSMARSSPTRPFNFRQTVCWILTMSNSTLQMRHSIHWPSLWKLTRQKAKT